MIKLRKTKNGWIADLSKHRDAWRIRRALGTTVFPILMSPSATRKDVVARLRQGYQDDEIIIEEEEGE